MPRNDPIGRPCAQFAIVLALCTPGIPPAAAVDAYRVKHNCYDTFSPGDLIREETGKNGTYAFGEDEARRFIVDLECDCTLSLPAQRQLQIVLDAKMGEQPLNPYVWVANAELKLKLLVTGQGRAGWFEVISLAQRAAELNPAFARASLALAKTDLLRNDIADAILHLDAAIKLGAPRDETLLVKASISRIMNNERDARIALEEVIDNSPAVELKAAAGIELGDLFEKEGKLDDAERQYRFATSLQSCTRVPDRRLASLLIFAKNKLTEARAVLTRANPRRRDVEVSRL